MPIPLCKPSPAKLSESAAYLREIEERAILSNFGPLSVSFEQNLVAKMFGGEGECLTVCNATIGLMISIRQAIESRPKSRRDKACTRGNDRERWQMRREIAALSGRVYRDVSSW